MAVDPFKKKSFHCATLIKVLCLTAVTFQGGGTRRFHYIVLVRSSSSRGDGEECDPMKGFGYLFGRTIVLVPQFVQQLWGNTFNSIPT